MKIHYGFDELKEISWMEILPIVLPILVISLSLIIIALIDLYRHRKIRENTLLWTIVILFFNIIGPILYFTIGRKGGRA